MVAVGEKRVAFGFPVSAPGGRLRCWGEARVQVQPDLPAGTEPQLAPAIGAALGKEVARAAARRCTYEEAIDQAEAALRERPLLPGVQVVAIETMHVADADKREVFARRPTSASAGGPAPGSATMAYWQGQWYPARIVEIASDQAKIQWDGSPTLAWVPLAHLRARS